MKAIDLQFNNVTEFERYLDKNSNKPSHNDVLTRSSYDFFQTHDWEGFEKYMAEGNKDVTADLRRDTKMYIDKFEELMTEQSQYVFDVVGEFFDIGAVMVGEPEAWIKEIKIEDEKFITLDIQGVYYDGTDLEMVRKNGSKVFAIATVLEEQGFLVKINMHYSSKNSGNRGSKYNATIRVKDFDGVLDYKKFGILLGVPFFRRGILRSMEIEYGVDVAGNFGQPTMNVEGQINLDSEKDLKNLEAKLMEK